MNSETSKKPLVIAHRGDTQAALENTLPAVASAMTLGVDGVEVDLRLTRDERVVLFHDDDLARLAGRPEAVEDLDLAALRRISLKGGFSIPTLEELLDLTRPLPFLNLELKVARAFSGTLERRVVETLEGFPKRPALLLSSFHPLSLRRLRRLAPEIPRGYLFQDKWPLHRLLVPWVGADSVNAPASYAGRRFVEARHRAGRRVFVWTVNGEDAMKDAIASGVDGLITDKPRKLLELVHGQQDPSRKNPDRHL